MSRVSLGEQPCHARSSSGALQPEEMYALVQDCHNQTGDASTPICCPVQDLLSKVLQSYVAQRVSNSADAEDLVRDILLKTCVELGNLRSAACFWSLLFQIAGNSVSDYWRRQYRATENRPEAEAPRPFEELAAEVIERCLVHTALGDLSPEDQEVVRLHYFEELSSSELGSRLGVSAAAARQRLSRAKRHLRHQLEKRGIGCESDRDSL